MKAMQLTAHSMNAAPRGSAADAAERAGQFSSGSLCEPDFKGLARAPEQSFAGKRPLEEGQHNDCLKVRDIMAADVKSCRPEDTIAAAAMAMNHADCRFLPVLDTAGRPVGVITDGDICLLGATDHRPLRGILVREMMSRAVTTCDPDTNVLDAVRLMRSRRIRHLPVVGEDGILTGVVSLTDLILSAEERGDHSLDPICREIAAAVREITQKNPGGRSVRIRPFSED